MAIPNTLRLARKASEVALVFSVLTSISTAACAEQDLYVLENLHLDAGIKLGVGVVGVSDANFGLGRFDTSGDITGETSVFFTDGYALPWAQLRFEPGGEFNYSANVSAVLAATRGDGDPAGFTDGDEEDIDLELANAGFEWNAAQDKTLEVTVGAQNIQIGTGFLFYDGDLDTGSDSNYWATPRSAFDWAGVAKFTDGPLVLTSFIAEADKDNGNPQFVGGDFEWTSPNSAVFGITAAHIFDDKDAFGRDGLSVVSGRALKVNFPAMSPLTFSSEIAYEFGDGQVRDYDAWGGYGQIAYSFDLPSWKPVLSYRFSYFSGGSATDPTETFDPLFYGLAFELGQSWGTWYQGEIVGEYLLFNSNEIAHQIKLSIEPSKYIVGAGLMYYHFNLAEEQYFGTPVTSTHFADEVDLYIDWIYSDRFELSTVAGIAFPGEAAEEVFGTGEATGLFEIFAKLKL